MFKKKKPACPHDWHCIGETFIYENNYIDVEAHPAYQLYCPLCDTEKSVRTEQWPSIQRKQELRNQHQLLNDF